MPREAWRDDPEYLGLWRMARQQPDESAPRFVLADWLEEHGHRNESWKVRLHALTGNEPVMDPDRGMARAGQVPMMQGSWRRLLAAPPADDLLCAFIRHVQGYRYLKEYRGRCGWDLQQADWSSATERSYLLAVPRLEMLACELVSSEGWDWIVEHLPDLLYFEADAPQIDAARLADLKRLPRLQGLLLDGAVAEDLGAIPCLPGLRHLTIGPYSFDAARLAALAPEVESLRAAPNNLPDVVLWPRLRSFRMKGNRHLSLGTREVRTLARHSLLERLNIRCGKVTAAAIKALAGLPRLRELTLHFQDAQPSPSLAALAAAPALETLIIEGSANEARLGEITKIPGLRVLGIGYVETDKQGFAAIAAMPHLEEVRLYGQSEDAATLTALAALPHLAKLDVQQMTMSKEAALAIKAACPPWVECLVPDAPQ